MGAITLAKLLQEIDIPCSDHRMVLGISDDSRRIQKDWLFISRKGTNNNGEAYAQAVVERGAVVLWEQEQTEHCYHHDHLIEAQAIILKYFYHDPCRHLCVIGVTGTNGKTSVSNLLAQMFHALGKRTILIGTGHIQYDDIIEEIDNTTPSACKLAETFALAIERHIPVLIMEVSSHAIDQKRIGFIRFDAIIYTNISRDHLDYHITRIHYQYTKFKLRDYLKQSGRIIVNHDDHSLHPLYDFHDHRIVTIGQNQAHLQISDITLGLQGSHFFVQKEPFETKLLGIHNIYNIVECLAVLHVLEISCKQQQDIVASLHGVAGRMEVHEFDQRFVMIDYAHTASSLQALLALVKQLHANRIIVVCGCGGERDTSKRPQMAQIAINRSDIAIFTSDNPRNEKPYHILCDMIKGINGAYEIFENRACAIKYAVKNAREHDIIVIAGKGDEQVQLINGKKYPFSDWECAKRMLEGLKYDT